jgi:hypothetical protein
MDGLETTRRWPEREAAAAAMRVPIVALTEIVRRWLVPSAQLPAAEARAAELNCDVA